MEYAGTFFRGHYKWSGNAARYSQAKSNGADLRFVDQHGVELKYEIANWTLRENRRSGTVPA